MTFEIASWRYQLAAATLPARKPFGSFRYTLSMAILARTASKEKPAWLNETRDFCKTAGIKIVGWGPDMLTVEAKSPDRSSQIIAQLGQLGFRAVENEDSANAGWLDLSRNPEKIIADQTQRIASLDVSRRRWIEQIEPLFFALGSLMLVPGLNFNRDMREPRILVILMGVVCVPLFFWDGARIWGWRLELLPGSLRIRRYYSWTAIPWEQISKVELVFVPRNQGSVTLTLTSNSSLKLGKFGYAFAEGLRDRLRFELDKRHR